MKFCIICRQHVDSWLPFTYKRMTLSSEMSPRLPPEYKKLFDGIGSDINNFWCSKCRCTDRERHLLLYFMSIDFFKEINKKKILHIAPEQHLGYILRALEPAEYICGDLHPRDKTHLKINCENMQFNENYFDAIICNHVLEHVSDLNKALSELSRCLKPGGRLIAQTPYSDRLKYTLEFTEVPSRDACIEFYYQDDHVRLFGMDIVDFFHKNGFHGNLTPHNELLPDIDPLKAGVNSKEPFFNFIKNR